MEEEINSERNGEKRVRDDSDLVDSPEGERVDSDVNSPQAKRLKTEPYLPPEDLHRVDWDESESNSSEVYQIPDGILDILDEPDVVTDGDLAIKDLDSVIKSFEEEILHPSPPPPEQMTEILLSSECDEPQPDLGYLLEASDDELGLPPTISPAGHDTRSDIEHVKSENVAPEVAALNEILGLEGDLPSYDSFGFGVGEEPKSYNCEFGTVGGWFDNDSPDFSDFLYRPESLSAL